MAGGYGEQLMRVQVVTSAGTTKESTTVVPTLALKSRAETYSALLFGLGQQLCDSYYGL